MKNRSIHPILVGPRPTLKAIPNPACPILLESRKLLEKTQDLHRSMRKFKRSTQRCSTCPGRADCPTMRYLSQALDVAIHELRQEWGVDETNDE